MLFCLWSFFVPAITFIRKVVTFLLWLVIFGYICLVFALIYYPNVVDIFVFLNHAALPFTRNYSDFAHFGLENVRCSAYHIETPDKVRLGVWVIQPPIDVEPRRQTILYLHGNSGTRGTPHRIILYKTLANAGFDVVTFDYRGYADSTCPSGICEPTEQGLLIDSVAVYEWTLTDISRRLTVNKDSVILWGHSLGGGAATNLARSLCPDLSSNCHAIRALILESTFSDVVDAAVQYPLAWPLRVCAPVLATLSNALAQRHLHFNNTASLSQLRLPVLMFHAEDDLIVPAFLSHRAFLASRLARSNDWPPIEYQLFPAKLGYGHRSLHDAPELVPLLIDFIAKNGPLPDLTNV